MSDLRKLFESQISAAEQAHAQAIKDLKESAVRYRISRNDLQAYRNAFEAYTRGSEKPYSAPPLEDVLLAVLNPEAAPKLSPALPPQPPRKPEPLVPVEKVTKAGIIYQVIVDSADKGLKSGDIPALVPSDSPIPIDIDDVYRTLPRLIKQGKIWRDKQGRHFVGRQSEHMDETGQEALNVNH